MPGSPHPKSGSRDTDMSKVLEPDLLVTRVQKDVNMQYGKDIEALEVGTCQLPVYNSKLIYNFLRIDWNIEI